MTPHQSKLPSAVFIAFASDGATSPAAGLPALRAAVEADSRLPKAELTLPVGAGLVLCFDYPTRTLEFVRLFGARIRAAAWKLPPVRMGIHVATMSRVADDAEVTLSGGSIDGAARAALLAAPNQALATSQFQTLVVQLLKMDQGHFKHVGRLTGTDGKSIDGYEIPPFAPEAVAPAASGAGATPTEIVERAERLLAGEIGPLAKLLAKQTAAAQKSPTEFIRVLAESIPDPARRQAFIAAMTRPRKAP